MYIGDTDGFEANYLNCERFPREADYGDYGLGIDPEYELLDNGASATAHITAKTGADTPPYYTLTGSYDSRGPGGTLAAADQTVRVVLTKKNKVTFSAELWKDMMTGGSSAVTSGKVINVSDWTVSGEPEAELSWSFTVNPDHADGKDLELRSLQINGAELNIPFISNPSASTKDVRKEAKTTLPSGALVNLAVEVAEVTKKDLQQAYVRKYSITISGATRDVVVTGGSLTNGKQVYKEMVVSALYGVQVEAWSKANTGAHTTPGWYALQPGQALCTGDSGKYLENQLEGTIFNFLYNLTNTVKDTDGKEYTGNIRFKPEEGYNFTGGTPRGTETEPTLVLRGKLDGTAAEATAGTVSKFNLAITGPDSEGWYYTTLQNLYTTQEEGAADTCNIYLLEARAQLMQYLVVYQDGASFGAELNPDLTGTVGNMPGGAVEGRYIDNNSGYFYSVVAGAGGYSGGEGSNRITVPDSIPVNNGPERPASFTGWVVTDSDGRPYKWDASTRRFVLGSDGRPLYTAVPDEYRVIANTDQVDLRTLASAATLYNNEAQKRALFLTAWWAIGSPPFSYYVTFNYTDAAGVPHYRVSGGSASARHFTADDAAAGGSAGYTTSQYYMAKRASYFNLGDLDGLTITYDKQSAEAQELLSGRWKWFVYDDEKNQEGTYLWRNVPNGGEVDVWFKSTLGGLTVSKKVSGNDPVETDFKFSVTFTLPSYDSGSSQSPGTFFGEGEPYTLRYMVTAADSETERVMDLTKTPIGDYTGTFTL